MYNHKIFVLGKGATNFKMMEGSMGKIIYVHKLFSNVVVHCIDIYTEHHIYSMFYILFHVLIAQIRYSICLAKSFFIIGSKTALNHHCIPKIDCLKDIYFEGVFSS